MLCFSMVSNGPCGNSVCTIKSKTILKFFNNNKFHNVLSDFILNVLLNCLAILLPQSVKLETSTSLDIECLLCYKIFSEL